MNVSDIFDAIAQISGLLFVVSSMLAMGLSLTVPMIIEPLRNVRLVLFALLANFVLVPLLAYAITLVLPLQQSLQIGLVVLATAAGAPFLPKLVQGANGNVALGVGLMVLLMVTTIIYVPLVLPLLLPGVSVNAWDIAKSLIVLMLIPLAIGLLVKSHSSETADHWHPFFAKVSSVALLVLLVVAVGLNLSSIISLIGSLGLLALLLFIFGSFIIGYLLGGGDPATRTVLGLGTAQRNVSAAIVVTAQNFAGTDTLSFVLVGAILLLLVLLPTAKRLGARSEASKPAAAPAQLAAVTEPRAQTFAELSIVPLQKCFIGLVCLKLSLIGECSMNLLPIILIAIGVAVLLFGNRLAILGAAVGALLGVVLLRLLPNTSELWLQLALVGGLALLGLLAAGFARGIIDIVILVLGAMAGAVITLSILDLFNIDAGLVNWLFAVVGAVIGFMLIRRSRRGSRDWGMVILASLVGALLITRGLVTWFPSMQDTLISTLIVLALVALGIAFQSGMLRNRKSDAAVPEAPATTATVPPPAAAAPPAQPKPSDTVPTAPPPDDTV